MNEGIQDIARAPKGMFVSKIWITPILFPFITLQLVNDWICFFARCTTDQETFKAKLLTLCITLITWDIVDHPSTLTMKPVKREPVLDIWPLKTSSASPWKKGLFNWYCYNGMDKPFYQHSFFYKFMSLPGCCIDCTCSSLGLIMSWMNCAPN